MMMINAIKDTKKKTTMMLLSLSLLSSSQPKKHTQNQKKEKGAYLQAPTFATTFNLLLPLHS
jgi:hypothetical protein